ncbi:MAG: Holliday junction resolvase RuvX [Anaerolineae bacterium]|nr:Holliday junction resolvase RuvX [Anaerolineae bacterium]
MRYLALDLGDRRIGVALSDALGMIARPLEVFDRSSRQADFSHISDLIEAYGADALVAGLPLNMDGTEGRQAAWVRDYTAALASEISVPITLWDERLTTEEAKGIMRAQGKAPSKDWVDAVAAAVILQSYLDAQS